MAGDVDAEAEAIAARLTAAQRRAIMWLPEAVDLARLPTRRLTARLWALYDRRLAIKVGFEWWRTTPLGARVRAIVARDAQ